ncbi:MAG: PEP-utilizing enzyme [Actinomycetota bacterium]|nr:PEP-utilizing enzyme [Actinomycetota bacterium]
MDSAGQGRPEEGQDRFVIDLAGIGPGMLAAVGGKALNLGIIAAAGLPVPGGFCLTTAAYRAVVADLDGLAAALDGVRPGVVPGLVEATARMRTLILDAAVPEPVADALRAAYAGLGRNEPVAVRSSATAEDLPEASFAGQLDTFLNVAGADALLDAVRRCWASVWTDRAVAYRAASGIGQREVGIAVVVQRMVQAEVAGVLFTANPVTGTRRQSVIDAGRGLGDAVVSGAVNPDHFVLDTSSGRVLERRPGNRPDTRHGSDVGSPCLTDVQLRELAALGARAEELFGAPQDLEWAADAAGKIWLTQSRPITTLYPVPEGADPAAGTRVFLCASLAQGLVRPITPMGLALFQRLSTADNSGWQMPAAGLRPYVDLTPVVRSKGGRRTILRSFRVAEARSAELLQTLFEDQRFSVVRGSRTPNIFAGNAVRLLIQLPPRLAEAVWRPGAALRRVRSAAEELENLLEFGEPATAVQRMDYVDRIMPGAFTNLVPRVIPAPAAGFALLGAARWLLRGIAGPGELQTVLRGLPNNITTEMDLQLWHLATEVRTDPASAQVLAAEPAAELSRRYAAGALPPVLQEKLVAFLVRFGHRAVAEIDLGMPRWREDPAHLLGAIANYLRVTDPQQAPDVQFARAAAQAEEKAKDLVARAARRGRLRAAMVRLALRRARQLCGLREQPKYYLIVMLAALRRQLAAVGAELARSARIAEAGDVFFIQPDEVRVGLRGADLHQLVADRRRVYERELRRRYIPRLLLSDGTDVEAAAARTPGPTAADREPGRPVLSGSPASAGTVTGKARVILDPVGARLEPGEILVAPSTDPGWTPLFLTAGALVMEMGGTISHGAVVAREYGIPAVVGVPDATLRLATGQTITVDGAAGTITLADEGSS